MCSDLDMSASNIRRKQIPTRPSTDAPPVLRRLHVSIPVKNVSRVTDMIPESLEAVQHEYAVSYLEKLGATITPENIATVLANVPLDRCQLSIDRKLNSNAYSEELNINLYPQPFKDTCAPKSDDNNDSEYAMKDTLSKEVVNALESPQFKVGHVSMTFEDMKHKYLLPFRTAHQVNETFLAQYAMKTDAKILREVVTADELLIERARQRQLERKRDCSVPPTVTRESVQSILTSFYAVLPFDELQMTPLLQAEFRQLLLSKAAIQVAISIVNYCYTDVFRPIVSGTCNSPNNATTHGRLSVILDPFNTIKRRHCHRIEGVRLFLPLFVLGTRICVETVLRNTYPLSFEHDKEEMLATMTSVDRTISTILDPGEHFRRISALESSWESTFVMASFEYQRAKRKEKLQDNYYRTSEAVQRMLPHPVAGQCRKIVACKGGSAISHFARLQQHETMSSILPPATVPPRSPKKNGRVSGLKEQLELLRITTKSKTNRRKCS